MNKNSPPRFELQSVYDDGSSSEAEIVPVTRVPVDTRMNRRGALKLGGIFGTGMSAAIALHSIGAQAQTRGNIKNEKVPPRAAPFPQGAPATQAEKQKTQPLTKVLAHRARITTLQISGDGQFLVSGDTKGKAKIWSLPEAKLKRTFVIGAGAVIGADFNNKNNLLTVVSSNSIRRWSMTNWKLHSKQRQRDRLKAVAFSPDHRFVIVGAAKGAIRIIPFKKKNNEPTPEVKVRNIQSLTISEDGLLLVVNTSTDIILFALPELKRITRITSTDRRGRASPSYTQKLVEISPDEKHLAVATKQSFRRGKGTIALWKLPDDALQERLMVYDDATGPSYSFTTTAASIYDGLLVGHKNQVTALSFFSKVPFLVSGGNIALKKHRYRKLKTKKPKQPEDTSLKETIKIWSIESKSVLQSLVGNSSVSALSLKFDNTELASAGSDGTIMIWDHVDLDGSPSFKFRTFLFDPKAMDKKKKAASFDVVEKHTGRTISYTLPCGSPIPASAVCTCNCVPGSYSRPVRRRTGRTYCSCNKICTCVPVCQAHRLLHHDPAVRHMAEQLLLSMGAGQIDYMRWAAGHSTDRLRRRIGEMILAIKNGQNPDSFELPAHRELVKYLYNKDEVIAIMAAQTAGLGAAALNKGACLKSLPPHIQQKIIALLKRSKELHWMKRASLGVSRQFV